MLSYKIYYCYSMPFRAMHFTNMAYKMILILCYLSLCALSVKSMIIETSSGPVQGKLNLDGGVYYYSYQGIPYAEGPTRKLRFQPPIPKAPWTEVFDATKLGPVCPQEEGKYAREQMREDCLTINIFAPAFSAKDLPVLVFIHGGEMKAHSGNPDIIYNPLIFMRYDVIFVTMNYRLGALGFLSLGINEAAGNVGLKDILLALKWVNTNINSFGGNPNNITLGGNSAGSVLAHYLLLSNQSTNLFQQAILISGSALGYRFLARHPRENAVALAKSLGIETKDPNRILSQLQDLNEFDIVAAQENINTHNRGALRPFAPFVPCIENVSPHAIITEDPRKIIQSGIPQNVPILVGFNSHEGIKMLPDVWKDPHLLDQINENFEDTIPSNIEYAYGSDVSIELANSIRQFYFNGNNITNDNIPDFVNYIRDTQFSYPIDSWIQMHKGNEDSKELYYYVFNFDGDLNWCKIKNNVTYPGTSHADELGYLFVTKVTKSLYESADERSKQSVENLMTYFTDFIKTGNPTPENMLEDKIWLEYGTNRKVMLLNDQPEMKDYTPIHVYNRFWDDVYEQYYKYIRNGGPIQPKIVP